MNRLTKRTQKGAALKLDNPRTEKEARKQLHDKYLLAIEKLAAYEDTGLTPDEIINGEMLGGWIPCSERLPEKSGWYWVTVELLDGCKETNMTLYTPKNMWMLSCNETQVLAWQPLPEPWEGANE